MSKRILRLAVLLVALNACALVIMYVRPLRRTATTGKELDLLESTTTPTGRGSGPHVESGIEKLSTNNATGTRSNIGEGKDTKELTKVLTLFTVLEGGKRKEPDVITRTLLRNWAVLVPTINMITFVEDENSGPGKLSRSLNITVRRLSDANSAGRPYLKDLVRVSQSVFTTDFYGYVRPTVLLAPNISRTVRSIRDLHHGKCYQLLLLGQAHVSRVIKYKLARGFSTHSILTEICAGKLPLDKNAYDILIFKNIDWGIFPNFDVSLPGFDIYIPVLTPFFSFEIIDISETSPALLLQSKQRPPLWGDKVLGNSSKFNFDILLNFTDGLWNLDLGSAETRQVIEKSYKATKREANGQITLHDITPKRFGEKPLWRYVYYAWLQIKKDKIEVFI